MTATDTILTRPALPDPGPAQRRRRALGVVVLALWTLAMVASWWVGPRTASVERFRDAAAHGHVVGWGAPDQAPQPLLSGLAGIRLDESDRLPGRPVLTWTDDTHRAWTTDVTSVLGSRFTAPTDAQDTNAVDAALDHNRGVVGEWVQAQARAVPARSPIPWLGDPTPGSLRGLVSTLPLVWLCLVVWGPVPTRGTRWFWFWFGQLGGVVGLVALAVAEYLRPRPGPAGLAVADRTGRPVPDTLPAGRRTGWWGVLFGLVTGVAVDGLVSLLL